MEEVYSSGTKPLTMEGGAWPRCNALVKKVKAMPGCNAVVRIDQEVAAVWYHRSRHSQGVMPEMVKVGGRASHRQGRSEE